MYEGEREGNIEFGTFCKHRNGSMGKQTDGHRLAKKKEYIYRQPPPSTYNKRLCCTRTPLATKDVLVVTTSHKGHASSHHEQQYAYNVSEYFTCKNLHIKSQSEKLYQITVSENGSPNI